MGTGVLEDSGASRRLGSLSHLALLASVTTFACLPEPLDDTRRNLKSSPEVGARARAH